MRMYISVMKLFLQVGRPHQLSDEAAYVGGNLREVVDML